MPPSPSESLPYTIHATITLPGPGFPIAAFSESIVWNMDQRKDFDECDFTAGHENNAIYPAVVSLAKKLSIRTD